MPFFKKLFSSLDVDELKEKHDTPGLAELMNNHQKPVTERLKAAQALVELKQDQTVLTLLPTFQPPWNEDVKTFVANFLERFPRKSIPQQVFDLLVVNLDPLTQASLRAYQKTSQQQHSQASAQASACKHEETYSDLSDDSLIYQVCKKCGKRIYDPKSSRNMGLWT